MASASDGAARPLDVVSGPGAHPGLRRGGLDERRVLRVGLQLSAGFVAVAMAAYALPAVVHGHWAGLHLALAGAAMVAIGTFMPHFGVTLAGSVAEPASLRLAGVVVLAAGYGRAGRGWPGAPQAGARLAQPVRLRVADDRRHAG